MASGNNITTLLQRGKERISREIGKLPQVQKLQQKDLQKRLDAHKLNLPPVDDDDQVILNSLRDVGSYIAPLDNLPFPETTHLIKSLSDLKSQYETLNDGSSNYIGLPYDRLLKFPGIYSWGLSPRLLDLVENYIGLPVIYRGAYVRREVANAVTSGVRQWHIDVEDYKMIKVIIYLNDVTEGGGPFEYLPFSESTLLKEKEHYVGGYIKDERINSDPALSAAKKEALYPKNTALFVDTCCLFHRAQPPRNRDRFTVTFSWSSNQPSKAIRDYAGDPSTVGDDWTSLFNSLSSRQRAALPYSC